MKEKKITAVICKPGKYAYKAEIGTDLNSLQSIVGGFIEFYSLTDRISLICNEEGKLIGLPLNRAIRDEDGRIIEVIAGSFIIVKEIEWTEDDIDDDGLTSLSDEEVQMYLEKFHNPDDVFIVGHEIIAIPYEEQ